MSLLQKLFGKKRSSVKSEGNIQDTDGMKVKEFEIKPNEQEKLVAKEESSSVSQQKQQVGGFNQETWDKVEILIKKSKQYVADNSDNLVQMLFRDYNTKNDYDVYKRGIVLLNKEIDKLEQRYNTYCACSNGCAYCCEQIIYVTLAEKEILRKKLNLLSEEEKKQIREKNKTVLEIMGLNKIPLTMDIRNEALADKVNEDYLKLQIPCPLLDVNNSCIVYEVRPSSCWPYRNYGHKIDCKGKIAEHSYPHSEMVSIMTAPLNMFKSMSGKDIFITDALPKIIKEVLG